MVPLLLTKLDTETASFVSELVNQGNQKSKLVSLALAKVLSAQLPVMIIPSDYPEVDFARLHKVELTQKIIRVNELVLVNVDETLDLVKKFYIYQYNVHHSVNAVPYLHKDTAVCDFFGISKVFSPDILELITDSHSKLTYYISKFTNILEKAEG